jgi:hypothetical protein
MSAENTNLCAITLTLMFSALGDHLAGIAATPQPKTLSDHLIAVFMAVTSFYHDSGATMPPELLVLLKDMYQTAHCRSSAHALKLMHAVYILSHCAALRNDPIIRLAISDANVALLTVVV